MRVRPAGLSPPPKTPWVYIVLQDGHLAFESNKNSN